MDRVLYSGVNKLIRVSSVGRRQHVHNDNNQVTKCCVIRSCRINFSGCGVLSVYKTAEFSKSMLSIPLPWQHACWVYFTCALLFIFFILCQTILFFASCYSILCNYGVGKSPHLNQYCNSPFFYIISFKYVF